MTTDDLAALDVGPRVGMDSSVLALWCPESSLADGLRVMHAWGYVHKQLVHWIKPQMGMGRLFRVCTEVALIGIRGKPGELYGDRRSARIRNHFEAPRTKHSAKPDHLHVMLELLLGGPYLEMFGRVHREGWTVIGNEAPLTYGQDIRLTLELMEKGQGQWATK